MADPYVGEGFSDYIGTRTKPGQTQVEFYNKQNSSLPALSNPQELAYFAGTISGRSDINAGNVFDVLKTGFTPRAQALDQIKTDLNNYQQQAFNSGQTDGAKRASSSITDSINSQQSELDKYLKEYSELRTKLSAVAAPNFQDTYNQLREQQGIPGLEQDYASLGAQRRELPYVERANTGNAGVATEAQLAAQTNEKDIPLYIKQANALDRLKLAQDFINNSLNLRELDYNTSRQALLDAANLTGQTIDFSRTSLNDLIERQRYDQQLQQQAQQFALTNAIDQPYYQIGNVIYDTATQSPKYINKGGTISTVDGSEVFSKPEQFFKSSGIGSFDEIYHLNSTTMADKNAVLDLRQKYPDAGILASDSFTVASSKLKNSRIYQDQVRGPQGPGPSSLGVLGLTNQQIDNISPLVSQFQNSPIVQNYNTIGEGYSFVRSLSNDTKNPADDQALIYALAKALDPGSVVREGEYATVQKYAQSMVQSYGKSVTQALSGSGFLSQDARNNIKKTIESRFRAAETSYNNLYNETSRRINLIGNTDKGNQLLNNYGGAFAPKAPSDSFIGPVNPTSQPTSQPTQQQQQNSGFWSKTINWLFGED